MDSIATERLGARIGQVERSIEGLRRTSHIVESTQSHLANEAKAARLELADAHKRIKHLEDSIVAPCLVALDALLSKLPQGALDGLAEGERSALEALVDARMRTAVSSALEQDREKAQEAYRMEQQRMEYFGMPRPMGRTPGLYSPVYFGHGQVQRGDVRAGEWLVGVDPARNDAADAMALALIRPGASVATIIAKAPADNLALAADAPKEPSDV